MSFIEYSVRTSDIPKILQKCISSKKDLLQLSIELQQS